MFENILKSLLEEQENKKTSTLFYIENGYGLTWAPENRTASDKGLKDYSTDARWNAYKAGTLSREAAVEKAQARYIKKLEKETAAKIARLETIAAAPDIDYIMIDISWNRSSVWGYNPAVETSDNKGCYTTGRASGCGYDKESAAVAESFNRNNSILKLLYTIKENALAAGATDKSGFYKDNRACCGYGAGYTALPYFEGGVGVGCFWDILKKAGFKVSGHHTKTADFYHLTKTA